jgi:polyhydroxyalkanoate synthase
MPAKMHTFYLRNMYIKNLLVKPGGITLAGEPIDLNKIQLPAYFLSTVEDHIAPWKSTYMGARLLPGPVKFVLAGSGHIAGVVNPPSANKYCHWTNAAMPDTADEWLAAAERHEGSWWTDWNAWTSQFGGDKIQARVPGDGKLKAIEPAPGAYVKLRLGTTPAESKKPAGPAPEAKATQAAPAAAALAPSAKQDDGLAPDTLLSAIAHAANDPSSQPPKPSRKSRAPRKKQPGKS